MPDSKPSRTEQPEFLEWPDGRALALPTRTFERTALWAARLTEWIRHDDPEPEMIERAFQGMLDEERRVTLYLVEQKLQELF